jgi:hypothetical protein
MAYGMTHYIIQKLKRKDTQVLDLLGLNEKKQ